MKKQDKALRRNEENMQEHADKELFVKQLREMLDWYTFEATEEEYSESNVENILNLLDNFDPIGEEEGPQRDAAWERFRRMAGEELLARTAQGSDGSGTSRAEAGEASLESGEHEGSSSAMGKAEEAAGGKLAELAAAGSGLSASGREEVVGGENLESAERGISTFVAGRTETVGGEKTGRTVHKPEPLAHGRNLARFGGFSARHKYIVAAVLVILILAISGTAHAIATQGSDFFFWLKRDGTGMEMMVSPEGLDDVTEKKDVNYYKDSEELPDWAREWSQIAEQVEMPEGYEFQYFEVNEYEYYQSIAVCCASCMTNEEILLGMWAYYEKVSYHSEGFGRYSYVQSYEVGKKELDVFNGKEENGDIFYAVCFYVGNCQYWVKGQNDLDEVKQLAEQYLNCVQEICDL